jgi:hypothetical protein
MINSEAADQTTATRPYNPTLQINLNQPIEKATSMQLMSFSTSNDFFNIRAGNNTFSCMLYTLSGTPSIERRTYTLDTGLFTIQEIVNTLNAKAAEATFNTMTPVFTLLASNKVQITASSTGTQTRRFVLFSASNFTNSIVHRLGFHASQVFTRQFSPEASFDFLDVPGAAPRLITLSAADGIVYILSTPEATWSALGGNALLWKTNGVGESKNGNNIGFENYVYLLMKCSLVSNDFQSIVKQEDGTILVQSDNVLQKIETTTSTYSYLHWGASGLNQPFTHSLSGKNIQSFSLTLTDDQGNPFLVNESKHWTCVLRFETAAENNNANNQNFLKNENLRFRASHNCVN